MLRTSERRRVATPLIVLAAVAVAGGVLLWGRERGAGAIASSQALIVRDSRFVNGPTSGATFARISQRLLSDAKHCAAAHGSTDPRCVARFQAAAYSSVTAVALLGCTQPGVYQARQALYTDLRSIQALDHDRPFSAPVPTVPQVPTC